MNSKTQDVICPIASRYSKAAAALAMAGTVLACCAAYAEPGPPGADAPVLSERLPNVPGKTLSAVVVKYPPGGKSPAHHHAGSVFAYVLSGHIRSQVSGAGPARVYGPGEVFFEPPGSQHLVSENASATEPASLLAVFVADDGAQLTALNR
jgi:quercetin dioxygenase-like cupin family protein